jgi:hypothetical protein
MNKYLKTYIRNRNITLSDVRKLNSGDLGIKYFEVKYVDIDIRDVNKSKIPEIILNKDILEKYFLNQTVFKNITDYDFDADTLSWLLSVRPEYIIYFKDKLDIFTKNQVISLLSWQPELADYFNLDNFDQIDYEHIADYNRKQGLFLKKFRHKVGFYFIRNYLADHPNEYMDFIDVLKERGVDNIDDLVFRQPEILKYMDVNDIFNSLRSRDVTQIINDFPHMRKFFEDIDYL